MKADELLRRLALNDEEAVRSTISAAGPPLDGGPALDERTLALVRLAALLAVGAATVSCRVAVERARAAGATEEQLTAVLVAVGPAIGAARLVGSAPLLALALDHDVEGPDTPFPDPQAAGDPEPRAHEPR